MSVFMFILIYLAGSAVLSLLLGAFIAAGSNKSDEELEFEKEVLKKAEANAGVQF